jgi:two-component system chemotaxis response regulator CheB
VTRVLVICGSPASRRLLRHVLEAERDINIIHELNEPTEAMNILPAAVPDVVAIDATALSAAGLLLIERIMSESPRPIVVLSDLAHDPGDEAIAQAMRRGALAVQARPTLSDLDGAAALRASVRQLAKIKVVRHPRSRHASAPSGVLQPVQLPHPAHPSAPLPGPAAPGAPPHTPPGGLAAALPGSLAIPLIEAPAATLVGIGSSAGGPAVLADILAELPRSFAAAVLVVQHLPVGFAEPFAAFLQSRIQLRVVVAREPQPIAPGQVIVAADGAHLVVKGPSRCGPLDGPPVGGHRPSVDLLFESMARYYNAAAVGVVLSGIGSDGTAGLRAIRAHGGLAIAQDAQSAAVNGMPRSASESGAAELVLPPLAIAHTLLRVCAPHARGGSGHGG